ncbi:ESPR-type extended signal peptide-containing protein, partial [Enterobacter roggenkampii]|uniref:ESPR-type extended signal peptide-containing protein n=1 Tax=Enterobacter roggenkampii TaxID=1812935 RepID=UPI0021D3BE90
MNRIYRLVWNRVKGCLIVVSELAKSTGKKSTLVSLLVISNASLASSQAFASDIYSEDRDPYIQITANNLAEKISISPLEHNNALYHVAITPFKGLVDAPDNAIVIVPGVGGSSIAEGAASVAIGVDAVAKGATGGDWSSIAINGEADGKASIAFGEASRVIGQRSIAVGNSSSVAGERSVALGADAKVDASNSAAIGNASTTDRDNTVSFGNTILRRQLINLSAGTDINDAIIVEQLTPILNALGGGASLDTLTGTVKGPQYALNSVDAKTGSVKASTMPFTTLEAALNNLSDGMKNLSNSSVRYDDAGVKGVITLGTTGNKTRLTNLADALITDTSTDAVTGGQLHAVKYDILANQNNIASNKSEISLNKANIASNSAYLSINTSNIAANTAGVVKNGANLRGVA